MKQIKKTKFTLEKFEVAKLQNPKSIIGGTGANGDPFTTTGTSKYCSYEPTCKDKPVDDNVPIRPSN